jgi:hypothetical protein
MKATKLFTLLVGSSLLLSASAFAGNGNKKSLHIDTAVTVEGKQLAAGDYKVEWSGTGPDVKLNILKGKETVASVDAHIVSVPVSNQRDGYSSSAVKDGSPAVTQIFFSGEKYDLEIGQASASSASGAATTSPN